MKVEQALSRKLTVMTIAAMIAVVFIHSTAYFTMENPAKWNVFGEILITRSFSRWAVPFFFVLSGFWLGRDAFVSGGGLSKFYRKKMRTLLIPYLSWCILGMLLSLPLIAGNNLLTGKGIWERTVWSVPGFWDWLDAFWGITSVGPKTNMPLWFVRSLIILFILSPVWRLLLSVKIGRVLLFAMAVSEIFFVSIIPTSLALPSFAFGWFIIGALISRYNVELWCVAGWGLAAFITLFVCSSVWLALLSSGIVSDVWKMSGRLEMGLVPLFGIPTFWGLYDRIEWCQKCAIPWGMKQTFFIYCVQEIMCGYFISSARSVFGKTDVVTFALTLVVPWLVLLTCMILATLLHKLTPRFYNVITGGRG